VTDVLLDLAGEQVRLLPERALFWPSACALVVADLHWGKAAAFRAAGIPIPGGATRRDLDRLDAAIARTGARRLIVLGDLFHARAGRVASRTLASLRAWRAERETLEIQLVRGNHDRHSGDPPADLRINSIDAPAFLPPFVLRHEPALSDAGYTLAGHIHPGIVLAGRGLFRERLPCFVVGERMTVLPPFGSFTGLGIVTPQPGERVFVLADGDVVGIES
jgi:DNA ligase-associated metallophosphoesterase